MKIDAVTGGGCLELGSLVQATDLGQLPPPLILSPLPPPSPTPSPASSHLCQWQQIHLGAQP